MQNAHRAKSMKEVELEKAAVHDDAQWDVGQEVREAWGLLSVQDTSYVIALILRTVAELFPSQNVTYEASYLPFLFSDTAEDTNRKAPPIPMGRRKFTNGVEDDPTEKVRRRFYATQWLILTSSASKNRKSHLPKNHNRQKSPFAQGCIHILFR